MTKREVIEIPMEVSDKLKQIGVHLSQKRQAVGSNYKKFAESHSINSMTLWRIEQGKDYRMSSFLEVLKAIGISPEEFFKGIK